LVKTQLASLLIAFVALASSGLHEGGLPDASQYSGAIIQAIQDEIYDYGYEGWGWDAADKIEGDTYQMHVYIEPTARNYSGRVIYKLMPYGEVLRIYAVQKNGLIRLDDNPELGFGAERPDRLTLYLDDDEVSQFRRTWLRTNFTIELHPSKERLRQGAERQIKRGSHSVWLDPGWRNVPAGHDPRCRVK
jgi:hypothetical protein